MSQTDKFAQLKNMLPAIPSIVDLKTESPNSLCGPCPKCQGTDRFVYRTDSERFWCRHCHEKPGDVIDFHKWFYGTTTKALLEQYFPEDKQENQGQSKDDQWEKILNQNTNKDPIYRLLCENRKISKTTADRSFNEEKIRFSMHKNKSSVACAYTSLNGKGVLSVQFLTVDGSPFPSKDESKEPTNKEFRYGDKAGSDCFFQAGESIDQASKIILCEAVINALSCADCLPEVCALAIGSSTYTKKVAALREYRDAGKKIVCFFDNDDAGRKATQTVAKIIGVKKTLSVEWEGNAPEGFDANDLLKNDDRKTIIEMVKNAKPVKIVKKSSPKKEKNDWTYRFTELGNAERFADQHRDKVRYVMAWRKWIFYDGKRWQVGADEKIRRLAQETAKGLYHEAAETKDHDAAAKIAKWAGTSCKSSALTAMLKEASALLATDPGILDANPWLFNCNNCTINLKTGLVQPHRRSDFITKITPADFLPEATAPIFKNVLNTCLDQDIIDFLQRFVGYSTSGSTKEQIIVICYGTGLNGKSTVINCLAEALGDYAQTTRPETLMVKYNNQNTSDLAKLKGARLVTAAEGEDGQRLAESAIKQMTGGEKIQARALYADWFEFTPEFKIILCTNHKPIIRGTDYAIWRRIRLIPWAVTIPEAEQDKELPEKLKNELPGVLRWIVEGAAKWLSSGLETPDKIKIATQAYQSEQNIIQNFLECECIERPDFIVGATDLFKSFDQWRQNEGQRKITQTKFGRMLQEMGYKKTRQPGTGRTIYHGFGLESDKNNDDLQTIGFENYQNTDDLRANPSQTSQKCSNYSQEIM